MREQVENKKKIQVTWFNSILHNDRMYIKPAYCKQNHLIKLFQLLKKA